MATQKVQTLVIDNFSGEITADLIGSLNSGLSPIGLKPFGKLPLGQYKNRGLQFVESAQSIGSFSGTNTITLTMRTTVAPGSPLVVGVDTEGILYNITVATTNTNPPVPDGESITKYTHGIFDGVNGSGTATADVLHYGGGIYYDPTATVMVIATDTGCYYSTSSILTSSNTATFTTVQQSGGPKWLPNHNGVPRPVCFFLGTLYVADGNNIASLNSTYTSVVNTTVFSPALPPGWIIRDMKVSPDGSYMIILASIKPSTGLTDFIVTGGQQPQFQPFDSVIAYWNGTDLGLTSIQYFKGLNITSVVVSSTDAIMFAKDMEGTGIFDLSGNKLVGIDDVTQNSATAASDFRSYPPLPFSIDALGKKFFFQFQMGFDLYIYMFDLLTRKLYSLYIDALTEANGSGIPGGLCIASIASDIFVGGTLQLCTKSKLYYFFKDQSGPTCRGMYLHLANYGANTAGSYSTQYEEFERKIRPVAIRIFTTPTVTGNSIIIRLVDLLLNNLFNKTYTFASGSDVTKAQGALNKIEFPVATKAVSELALQILPNASSPFFIQKVEIDYLEDLNPTNT
jgi:hypothetical protein